MGDGTQGYGHVSLDGDVFLVRFDRQGREFDPGIWEKDVEATKSVPGRRWNDRKRVWKIPSAPVSVNALSEVSKAREWTVTPQAFARIYMILDREKELAELSRLESMQELPGDVPVAKVLRPFQRAGVLYAMKVQKCLIADEMGLGKTIQAIAVAECTGSYPAVVVCPAGLKLNWQAEVEKWGRKNLVCRVLSGMKVDSHDLGGVDVLIVSYNLLGKVQKVKGKTQRGLPKLLEKYPLVERIRDELKPKMVIIDESHYVKNKSAARTRAVISLAQCCEYRIALTGTPVLNKPYELYPQLQAIGQFQKTFGSLTAYTRRYCDPKMTPFGMNYNGSANTVELNEKLRGSCMVRRLKADVLKELPPIQRAVVPVEMTRAGRKEYDMAEDDVISYLGNIDLDRADKATRAQAIVKLNVLSQLAARGKMDAVFEWVEQFLESGEKLILFGVHREMIDAVVSRFGKNGMARRIAGGDSTEARKEAQEAFQDPGGVCRLLVCNLQAAGVGLTLTAASNVAFFELGWTPAEHEQAEARPHRIGQLRPVTAWYLLAKDTVDEHLAKVLDAKRRVADSVMNGIEITDMDTRKELISMLKGRRLPVRRKIRGGKEL